MAVHTLPKRERLRAPAEYRRVFKEGCSYRSSNLILRVLPNGSTVNRLGIALAKGTVKRAAQRNYLRRIIKEVYRLSKPHKKKGFDLVLLSLRGDLKHADVKEDMEILLKKADIL